MKVIFERLFSSIFERLSGFNLIIVIVTAVLIIFWWWFSGTKKEERRKLIKRFIPIVAIIFIAGSIIIIRELFFISSVEISEEKTEMLPKRETASKRFDSKKLDAEEKKAEPENLSKGTSEKPQKEIREERKEIGPKEEQKEKIVNFKDKINYLKAFDKKVKVELTSIKTLEDGEIECKILLTNLAEEGLAILALSKPKKKTYISDTSGNRYYYVSSKGITEAAWRPNFLRLQPRIPTSVVITFSKLIGNIDNINLVISFYWDNGSAIGYGSQELSVIFYDLKVKS
jgi:hypothetical protein